MRWLFVVLFISGCYLYHERPEAEQSVGVVYPHEVSQRPALDNNEPVAGMGEPVAAIEEPEHDSSFGLPVLFEADPTKSCENQDTVVSLVGTNIHWKATVTITYAWDMRSVVVSDQVDECGASVLQWSDITRISFRTRQDFVWEGGGNFVSGYYLVHVTNPDGQSSNDVGLNLQWCESGGQSPLKCNQ